MGSSCSGCNELGSPGASRDECGAERVVVAPASLGFLRSGPVATLLFTRGRLPSYLCVCLCVFLPPISLPASFFSLVSLPPFFFSHTHTHTHTHAHTHK